MNQVLYVILDSFGHYWAGDTWWATYFTEAKYFTNIRLAEKENLVVKGNIHKIIINPEKV